MSLSMSDSEWAREDHKQRDTSTTNHVLLELARSLLTIVDMTFPIISPSPVDTFSFSFLGGGFLFWNPTPQHVKQPAPSYTVSKQ